MKLQFLEINSPRLIAHNSYRRYVQLSPLLPFGMMLIISTIIFILIIFRRWPGLVAGKIDLNPVVLLNTIANTKRISCSGIVAGCLTSISIYLLLLTLKEQRLVYEWSCVLSFSRVLLWMLHSVTFSWDSPKTWTRLVHKKIIIKMFVWTNQTWNLSDINTTLASMCAVWFT